MKGCYAAFTPGTGPELPLDQRDNNLLDEEGRRRYQSIVGTAKFLAQISTHDVLYGVNQLAREMSEPSNGYMGAAKHLLLYFAGSTEFLITYKQGELSSPPSQMLTAVMTQTTPNQRPLISLCSQTA